MEDIKEVITAAKLKESELLPLTQELFMTSSLSGNLTLMELTPELLDNLVKGQKLTIKGCEDEAAIVCTDSSTFELKAAETSNSLLLMQNISWPEDCKENESSFDQNIVHQEVSGIFHQYFILRPCPPKLSKLYHILERNPYQGKEQENNSEENYTFQDLLGCIQASESELNSALKQMQACTVEGYIRILDTNYKFKVFSDILDVIESKSLPLDQIPKDSVLQELEDLETREILNMFFFSYAYDTGCKDDKGDNLFALKEDDVCRLYAEVLLKSAGKFNLQEFLESWQESVPEGMTTNLSQLRGIAIIDLTHKPAVIFHFPDHELPEDIQSRFIKLFKIKKKWCYEDIYPYIRAVTNSDQDVKVLLAKYTRTSVIKGVKMYSSKW